MNLNNIKAISGETKKTDQLKAYIFDIQSFSVHDGPGCRSTVFLSGCPLRCKWCANPESWNLKKHIIFAQSICKYKSGCRVCVDVCEKGGLSFNGKPEINRDICKKCTTFKCANICPEHSLRQCVREMSIDELFNILCKHRNNWGSSGGVTFSGGEPFFQYEYIKEILKKCNKAMIHTAVETTACIPTERLIDAMRYVNFAFIDIKHMDFQKHKDGTGVNNDLILHNISALKASKWNGRLVLRQPVIGGYNDGEDNALQLIEFMQKNNLFEINLLKFHRMGESKWHQSGMEYELPYKGDISEERLKELQQIYLDNDIACYIADQTPF